MQASPETWHLLQISGALDEELALALSERVQVIGWRPERKILSSLLQRGTGTVEVRSPSLVFRSFPLLPGYARPLVSTIARIGPSISSLLARCTPSPAQDVLVCTTPYMAPVAERWPGPVVYWLTDRIASYASASGIDVPALDRRMCRAAALVCPNSERLRQYLIDEAACEQSRIVVLPNATRSQNLLPSPLLQPAALPQSLAQVSRPVAGIIGNMGGNLDWQLLLAAVTATPWLTWMFVGPVRDDVLDAGHRSARERVRSSANACFVGARPYGELVHYARGFDAAVLPYLRCEPTYSGSSTRYYEHLAACRPMLATRGFAELLGKEPLLKLVDSAQELVADLEGLSAHNFRDGNEAMRWETSLQNTWQVRAQTMQQALASRLDRSKRHAA